MADKLRVMVDANVLVAGSAWPRFPYQVLRHATFREFQLVLSPRIIQEARDALQELAPERLSFLEEILTAAKYENVSTPSDEEIQNHSKLIRDPKDIHVALAAINAKVDYLVTQDRDFTDIDESTTELHAKLKVILPGTFPREHMGWTSEALETVRNRTWRDLK